MLMGISLAFAKGDTLVIAVPADAKTLDPHATPESSSHNVNRQIYESLVAYNEKQEIVPLLAERWEVLENGMAHKFFLKKGVKFHNGEELTADDVVFTFKRATSPEGGAVHPFSLYIDTPKLQAIDKYTVIVYTKQPMGASFLASMNHPWSSILNKKAVEAAGKDYGMNPVGTGRFKYESWAKGDRITLVRHEDYHGSKAPLKKMVLRVVIESTSRTIELESGAVDLVIDPPAVDIKRIEAGKSTMVKILPGQNLFYLGMDITKAPYSDPLVRQALNYSIDRPGIVAAVFKGYAEPANGPMPSSVKYNKYKETPQIPRDLAKAKALLKEAGYPNGFKGVIIAPDRSELINCATVAQANFREIGVEMEIKIYEWGTFIDVIRQPGHEPFIQFWWGGAPALDPFFFMTPQYHSAATGQTNRSFVRDKAIDALLDKGAALPDGQEREAVYHELWDKVLALMPWVYLATARTAFAMVNDLEGINFTPSAVNYYGTAYFKK